MVRGSGSREAVPMAFQTLHKVSQTDSALHLLVQIWDQKAWSATRELFSPQLLPDNWFSRQLLHFHIVAFSGFHFRNRRAANVSSDSDYEQIMQLAEVRLCHQPGVFLGSHKILALRFMAESLTKRLHHLLSIGNGLYRGLVLFAEEEHTKTLL